MLATAGDERRTKKRRSFMGTYTWTHHVWPTINDLRYQLFAETGCSICDLPGAMGNKDGWVKGESRKSELSVQFDDVDDYDDLRILTVLYIFLVE